MFSFILIVVVVIMAIILGRKDREAREKLDYSSMSYRQGYWDGVRASEQGESVTDDTTAAAPAIAPAANFAQSTSVTPAVEVPRSANHLTVNIALYVASLLLVGGISLFVLFIPFSGASFFCALALVVAYYGFGFMLYKSMPILRPVSIAFVGTALAAMPYVGYLLHQAFIPDATISWFVTSLVCLIAYFYAAIRLQSEIIGYAIIVLLISTTNSFAGMFGASILWFIVTLMAVGAAITFVATANPSWLPQVLKRPFIATQHVIVPLAVVWAFMLWAQLDAMAYTITFAVATLYYGAAALQSQAGSMRRTWLWALARATLTVALAWLTYQITTEMYMVGVVLAAVGIVQVIVSALHLPVGQRVVNQHEFWVWGGLSLLVIGSFMAGGSDGWEARLTAELASLTIIAAVIAWYLRRSAFIGFSVYGLVLLPYIVTVNLLQNVSSWVPVVIYSLLVLAVPLCRWKLARQSNTVDSGLAYAAQATFSVMAIFMGSQVDGSAYRWAFAGSWIVVTIAAYLLAWVGKRRWVVIVANILTVLSLFTIADALHLTDTKSLFFVTALSFVGFYGCYLLLRMRASKPSLGHVMWISAVAIGLAFPIMGIFDSDKLLAYGFCLVLSIAGAALAYDDYERRRLRFADIGFIAVTIGLQRMLALTLPEANSLLYSHWWALLAFTLGYLHVTYGATKQSKELVKVYRVAALIIITLYGLTYTTAHDDQNWVKALFLFEHVLMVVYGLVRDSKIYTIWGAVGVTIAILGMLPGLAFVLLPLLGIGIIGVVIYVITKAGKNPPDSTV